MTKRRLIDELLEGVSAMKSHREGTLPLRAYNVETTPQKNGENKLVKKQGNVAPKGGADCARLGANTD